MAQDSPAAQATFRTSTNLVQIDVSVLDGNRLPVRGLTAADFAILENGRPRPVTAFLAVDRPMPTSPSAVWMREAAPDVATNASVDGQVVVIVVDDASLYQSGGASLRNDRWTLRKAQEIGISALDQLGASDRAAVVYTRNTVLNQGFTADRARLRRALEVATIGLESVDSGLDPDGIERGACFCGVCSISTLERIANELRALSSRRKMIVYISAGVPVNQSSLYFPGRRGGTPDFATDSDECNIRRRDALTAAIRAASLANVAIYPFDPNGLLTPAGRGPIAEIQERYLLAIAAETGGRAVLGRNDQERVVPEILREGRSYYLLGFEPEDPNADGALRRVQVRVNRRGLDVRARSTFFVPSAEVTSAPGGSEAAGKARAAAAAAATDRLKRAIEGLLPASDLPLQLSVAPFAAATGRGALLVVTAGIRDRAFVGEVTNPASSVPVRVLTAAFNHLGRGVGAHDQTLTLVPGAAGVDSLDYEVLSRLDVGPGQYEVRLAVESDDGRTGSVYAHVDVPDFARESLALSGVLLEAVPSPASPEPGLTADVIGFTPTSRRVFAAGDQVHSFVRVYLAAAAAMKSVTVRAKLVDTADRIVAADVTVLDLFHETPAGTTPSADYRVALPVSDLAAGEYLLHLEANSGTGAVERMVRFVVQ